MKWTLKPKANGWYWLRVNDRDQYPLVVHVENGYVLGQIKIAVQLMPFQWYGPIKVPK